MDVKQSIRETIWNRFEEEEIARFPFPPHHRIPNFAGAEKAADRLAALDVWDTATTIKINPDAPQRPVRQRALASGKRLYMAVPRLADEKPFIELDPADIPDPAKAATIGGANEYGTPVTLQSMENIDMIVTGSVAVGENGVRVGKGEGYSDLEFALLQDAGTVNKETTIVTSIHESQYLNREITPAPHDVPMERIITPSSTIVVESNVPRPQGINWNALTEEHLATIPVLEELRE